MKIQLHHVGIRCNNCEESARFFVELFGAEISCLVTQFMPLSLKREPGLSKLIDLWVGDVRIHLFETTTVDSVLLPPGLQVQHICFALDSFAALQGCVSKYCALKSSELILPAVPFAEPSEFQLRPDGSIVVYVRDPDGNEIELTAPAPGVSAAEWHLRPAYVNDLSKLSEIIEEAYRNSDAGWTSEKELVAGRRIEPDELQRLVANPGQMGTVLVCGTNQKLSGCIFVSKHANNAGYFGMFAVDPAEQGQGIGKRLLEFAELWIADVFGCDNVHAQVLEIRIELLAYYERRGYQITDERTPFCSPENLKRPVQFVGIQKRLR